jgi:secreted trypsin-like serine protease
MPKSLFFLPIAFAINACNPDPSRLPPTEGQHIVHGQMLAQKTLIARTVVGLVSEHDEGQALCTGSILDEQTILTAAHCIDSATAKMYVVFHGKLKTAKPDNIRLADRAIQHPKWKSATGEGDLALVHFTGGLPKDYVPVTLAGKSLKLSSGEQTLLVGYGLSNAKKETGSGSLRQTETSILGAASSGEIMTDGKTSSVCFGDSGGPAFVEDGDSLLQWGVAHSVLNKECNQASLHTSVIPYEAWIQSTAKRLAK